MAVPAIVIRGVAVVKWVGYFWNNVKNYFETTTICKGESCGAESSYQAHLMKTHLRQCEKYGQQGYRVLENGNIRYYGEPKPARTPGAMKSRRRVREWDPRTGRKRTWHETLDHEGNIRQVRPERDDGVRKHYFFDKEGNLIKEW